MVPLRSCGWRAFRSHQFSVHALTTTNRCFSIFSAASRARGPRTDIEEGGQLTAPRPFAPDERSEIGRSLLLRMGANSDSSSFQTETYCFSSSRDKSYLSALVCKRCYDEHCVLLPIKMCRCFWRATPVERAVLKRPAKKRAVLKRPAKRQKK